jgi:hypothetical protein
VSDRLAEAQEALAAHRAGGKADAVDLALDLFSPPADLQAQAAIERVADHAGPVWRDEVLDVIEHLARRQDVLIADDVWTELEQRGQGLTYDRRALGAVLREACKRGFIEATPDYAPSARRHSSPLRVWRSCLRDGA